MSEEEQIALKAACVQAAATLRASAEVGKAGALNAEECAKLAHQLFEELTGTLWPKSKP
jgi:hypothetical protein